MEDLIHEPVKILAIQAPTVEGLHQDSLQKDPESFALALGILRRQGANA